MDRLHFLESTWRWKMEEESSWVTLCLCLFDPTDLDLVQFSELLVN